MQIREIPVKKYELDQKKVDEAHQRVWELVQYIALVNQSKNNIRQCNDGMTKNTLIITS